VNDQLPALDDRCYWCGSTYEMHAAGGPEYHWYSDAICLGLRACFKPHPKVVMATVPYAEYEAT